MPQPRVILTQLSREDLIIVARKLKLRGIRRLSKQALIDAILQVEPAVFNQALEITWWDRHKTAVYGWASIFGVIVGLIGIYLAVFPRGGGLSDPEFAYNMAMVRLGIRLETTHYNMILDVERYSREHSETSERFRMAIGDYRKESLAIKDVLRHLSPPDNYADNHKTFAELLEQYSTIIRSMETSLDQSHPQLPGDL